MLWLRIKGLIILSLIMLLLAQPAILLTSSNRVGFHPDFPHARVVVTRVVDGDTVHISPPVCVAGEYRTVVRLADIDAPELNTPEGEEARNALINLLAAYNNTVYLDIANYSRQAGCSSGLVDNYGRIVAVLYVRVNRTHILNVNKWMVDNGYAVIQDFQDDDFDPGKWSLYLEYSVESEKLPTVKKVSIYTGTIQYPTSWGIRVAVTPDKQYLGIAFSEGAPNYTLRVYILNNEGEIVNQYAFSPDKGSLIYANVFRGMIDIAANETGFLVAWTNFTRVVGTTTYFRTVLYSYVPIVGEPTTPMHIYGASYQYHPTVTFFIHSNETRWWVVGHSSQTTAVARYTINLLNETPVYTGRYLLVPLGGGVTSSPDTTPRVGVDIIGSLIYDPLTRNFTLLARNVTATTGHDIVVIVGRSDPTLGFFITQYSVDDREGDQGPEPDLYVSGGNYYSYFNLYPSIYSKILGQGRYVLTVYNASSTSLDYAIIDLQPPSPIVSRGALIDRGVPTTFYPWIASNYSTWLVAWSAVGWVNLSLLDTSGVVRSFVLADGNASYVRVVFDEGSGKYIIPYAITDETGTRNLYVAFYDTSTDTLEPWVLPVSTVKGVHETPLYVAVLRANPGQPGRIAIVTLEGDVGGNLVVHLVSESYPELQEPIPIPEPWYITVVVATATATFVTYSLIVKKRKH
ncbi:MAG: thermonuclease family protein [Desulfurococcaceae archaeon]